LQKLRLKSKYVLCGTIFVLRTCGIRSQTWSAGSTNAAVGFFLGEGGLQVQTPWARVAIHAKHSLLFQEVSRVHHYPNPEILTSFATLLVSHPIRARAFRKFVEISKHVSWGA
jgi:hypothetical protein